MANTDIKISALPQTNVFSNTDLFVVVRTPNTYPTTNTVSLATVAASLNQNYTPVNSTTIVSVPGLIFYDSNYLYITTATNYVKRVALSAF